MRHTVSDPRVSLISTLFLWVSVTGRPYAAGRLRDSRAHGAVAVSPQAAVFARNVITAVAPDGRERAKNLLWAVGKSAWPTAWFADLLKGYAPEWRRSRTISRSEPRRDQVNRLTSPSSMSGNREWARWLRRS